MITAPQTRLATVRRLSLGGLLSWLLEADRRYREARKLRDMPDFRLRDMGISRKDADRAWSRREVV